MYPAAYYGFTGYIFYVCNNEGYTKTNLPGKPDPMLCFFKIQYPQTRFFKRVFSCWAGP